ncbi:MAG: type II secretion system protein [Candidatus Gracilibacteria bacterium]|nr:type II secretion system protein [Candidatus Gracilibacteria bacterium]
MQKNNKAFTLVELIVVITILAILGTIAFINLQGYGVGARDSKRLSDVVNIYKKINIELSKGTKLDKFLIGNSIGPLTINGNLGVRNQGITNFLALNEDSDKFKDPKINLDYVLSYSDGGTGTGAYKFIQVATISEEKNEAVVIGNYYKIQSLDSPSLILNLDNEFVVDGGVDLPYIIGN